MWTPKNVQALRKRLKLDVHGFARLVGVDARSVQRWEAGDASPTASAEGVMSAIRESLDRDSAKAEKIVAFVRGAVAIGGLAYLLVKLFDLLTQDDDKEA